MVLTMLPKVAQTFRTIRFAMAYLLEDENNRVGIGATVQCMSMNFLKFHQLVYLLKLHL